MIKNVLLATGMMMGLIQFSWAQSQIHIEKVADINPNGSSNPQSFGNLNGALFFSATDGIHGRQLWKTDGTDTGTKLVRIINPNGDSWPDGFAELNGKLYFKANDGVNGIQLWVTDGTDTGTKAVKIVNAPQGDIYGISHFVKLNGKLYYRAKTPEDKLWVTDGTASGTHIVNTNDTIEEFASLTRFQNKLYFTGDNFGARPGHQLCVSDGTAAGTKPLSYNVMPEGYTFNYAELNNKLYFPASPNSSGTGVSLWSTDGTAAGIQMVAPPDTNDGPNDVKDLTPFKGKLYFSANDDVNAYQLWCSDGTAAGPRLLKVIDTPRGLTDHGLHPPRSFVPFHDKLFFIGFNSSYPNVWVTDGTDTGTKRVETIIQQYNSVLEPTFLFKYRAKIYFIGYDYPNHALFATDGTDTGTYEINPAFATNSNALEQTDMFFICDSTMYFAANYDNQGYELYKLTAPADTYTPPQDTAGTGSDTTDAIHNVYQDEKAGFRVFPNPVTNQLFITAKNSSDKINFVRVRDVTGKTVGENRAKGVSKIALPTRDWANGVYFVEVHLKGMPAQTVKVVKKE